MTTSTSTPPEPWTYRGWQIRGGSNPFGSCWIMEPNPNVEPPPARYAGRIEISADPLVWDRSEPEMAIDCDIAQALEFAAKKARETLS